MENSMKRLLSRRPFGLGIVLVALGAAAIVATAQATKSSKPTTPRSGTVAVGKTALGTMRATRSTPSSATSAPARPRAKV
jgi:hypothetical protein